MALDQKRALAETRGIDLRGERQRLTFEAIFRLVEKLGTTFDVSKIASLFLMTLMGQLKLRRVSLYLVVPEKGSLEPYRSLGLAGGAALPSMAIGHGFPRWLAETNGPAALDEFCVGNDRGADAEEEMIRSLTGKGFSHAIALAEQGDLLGALLYSGSVTGEPFSAFDEEIIKMLARVASMTVKNAFLYQSAVASKLELERFADAKREFIMHTSHELRTPLTVLKSALWSLEPDEVDESVLVDMAKSAITRLEEKVDYILSLNDIELDKIDFKLEQAEVSSIVEEVLREMLPELEEKNVRVDIDDRARFRKAFIDPGKIRIVVRSILDNAVNFVPHGGNIGITIDVSESPPTSEEGVAIGGRAARGAESGALHGRRAMDVSSYVVIGVKDNGIGIPDSEIECIAEPFTMASNSSNRNVKGLGIGLAVANKIISGHGGAIFCRSNLGQGAQFSIWIPLDV
jgi:signal transduction histidine kinase